MGDNIIIKRTSKNTLNVSIWWSHSRSLQRLSRKCCTSCNKPYLRYQRCLPTIADTGTDEFCTRLCRSMPTPASIKERFYRAMHVVLARYCYRKSIVRLSAVCPSVTLWYLESTGWTSSKLITRTICSGFSLPCHNIGNVIQVEHP